MKKAIFFILCFTILSFYLFADEEEFLDTEIAWADVGGNFVWPNEELAWEDNFYEDETIEKEKKPFTMKRNLEFGLLNLNANFSNNYLSVGQFFQELLVLDIDELQRGLGLNFGVGLSPFFFNYNRKDQWGFGLYTGIDLIGAVRISGNLLTLSEEKNDLSDFSAAAFGEIAIPTFFHVNNFKIKVRPALYYPLVFAKPDIVYNYYNEDEGTTFNLGADVRVYTAIPMESNLEDGFNLNEFSLTARPGVDFNIGVEFPLAEALGLTETYSFLDFKVGVDLFNLPMVPSAMHDYMEIFIKAGKDEPITLFNEDNEIDIEELLEVLIEDAVYGEEKLTVLRPFKMHAWAHWFPFENKMISFIPTLGFAINPLYHQPFSFDGGIMACFNAKDMFLAAFGIGYLDRHWKNSLDLTFNLRAIELYLGVSLQSAAFLKSWSGAGVGVDFGLRFGW